MPIAEIVTIGTELLLGEIVDTNTPYLARAFKGAGIDIFRTMTVGDNVNRIAQAIQEALQRSDIIITTGGLGPTVDDPTRQAVAQAMGVGLEFRPELWDQIQSRFQRYGRVPGENNRRQAYIPQGALVVENPVGTAPAFICETGTRSIISLPGVPREMEYLWQNAVLPYLKEHFKLQGIIKTLVLHTASVGESNIDEIIGDLEALSNPTVGLLAHPGQVDIRVGAKAGTEAEADRMIAEVVQDLRQRLGHIIFGVNQDTLEGLSMAAVQSHSCRLAVFEAGLGGEVVKRLMKAGFNEAFSQVHAGPVDAAALSGYAAELHRTHQADLTLGASLIPGKEKQELQLILITAEGPHTEQRFYGGPPQSGPIWGVNFGLDAIRRYYLDK